MKDARKTTDESESYWDDMEHFGADDWPNVSLLLRFMNGKKPELDEAVISASDKKRYADQVNCLLKGVR